MKKLIGFVVILAAAGGSWWYYIKYGKPPEISGMQQSRLIGPIHRIEACTGEGAHAFQQSIAKSARSALDDNQGFLYQALQPVQGRACLGLTSRNGQRGVQ